MRDILNALDLNRRGKGERQCPPGRSSRKRHAIRRNELVRIRQQLERQLVMCDSWGRGNRLSNCKRRNETTGKQTETDEAMQTIHPSPAPRG